MPNDDLLKYLRSFSPSSTATKKGKKRDFSAPDRTIGPAKSGNIPLPAGHAEELNPQSAVDLGKVASVATLGLAPMLVANAKRGYNAAKKLHEGDKAGALAEAGGAAFDAATLHPAVQGLVGKIGGKLAGRISDQMLDVGSLPKRYAVITGENPGGSAIDAATNAANNAAMKKRFEDAGYKVTQRNMIGRYQDGTSGQVLTENPMLVHDVPERFAKLVAKEHGQNGVITQKGYHDMTSGQLFPSSGNAPTKDLPFTQLPNGQRFAANIDWSNPTNSGVSALPIAKGHNAEVKRITRGMVDASGGTNLPRVKAIDPAAAKHMASVYESLPKFDPAAKGNYDALNKEVAQQYKALQDQGYKFEFTNSDPYKSSKEMAADVAQNRTLKVFATPEDNFHPYMTPDQNNKFRAVHDLLAHAGEGHQFGAKGEENAYRVHMSTLSPEAQRALATETRGQNSWVNYGPNAHLPAAQRPFAEQKAALWPQHLLGDYDSMLPKPVAKPEPSEAAKNYVPNFGRAADAMISGQRAMEAADPIVHEPKGNGLLPNNYDYNEPVKAPEGAYKSPLNPPKTVADSAVFAGIRLPDLKTRVDNVLRTGFPLGRPSTYPERRAMADQNLALRKERAAAASAAPAEAEPTMSREKLESIANGLNVSRPLREIAKEQLEKLNNPVLDSAVVRTPRDIAHGLVSKYKLPRLTSDPVGEAVKFKSSPAEIRARVKDAWQKVAEPVPTDRPQPAGTLVDRSGIRPDEGPSTGALPERQGFGSRASSGQLKGIGNDEGNALTAAQILRGQKMMPSTFYPSVPAWLDAVGNAGGDPKMFHMASTAAAIRNGVPGELMGGSALTWAMKQGITSPEEIAAAKGGKDASALALRIRDAYAAANPNANRVQLMGAHVQSLGTMLRGDTPGAYKIPQYGLQKLGNAPGFVLDTHEAKGGTLAAPFHGYFADQGGFSNPEYGHVEQNYRGIANDLGISDRTAQESRWRGGGNITGLRTPANMDYAHLAEDMILKHARLTNQDPKRALRAIATGDQALFTPKSQPSLFDYE